ncbi:unnamed protein product, partial [Clonostachys rosea]
PLRQVFPDPSDKTVKTSDFKIDIIAVHGLNSPSKEEAGHALDTWRTPPGPKGHFWLHEDLPAMVPGARIFIYQYNAAVAFGSNDSDFREQANSLLETIRLNRRDAKERPILFFGHSMGGILIKQALINAHVNSAYSSIKDATRGLAFFATPQNGGDEISPTLSKLAVAIADTFGSSTESDVLSTLKKGTVFSEIMAEQAEQWRHELESYDIVSFWGNRDTAAPTESTMLRPAGSREHVIKLEGDHGDVCKFGDSDRDQRNLEIVSHFIRKLYWNAVIKHEFISTRVAAVTKRDGTGDVDDSPAPSEHTPLLSPQNAPENQIPEGAIELNLEDNSYLVKTRDSRW